MARCAHCIHGVGVSQVKYCSKSNPSCPHENVGFGSKSKNETTRKAPSYETSFAGKGRGGGGGGGGGGGDGGGGR